MSNGVGQFTSGSFNGAAGQAAADEAEDMAHLLSAEPGQQAQAEFMAEMQDFAADVNSYMGSTADNPPQQRSQYPG